MFGLCLSALNGKLKINIWHGLVGVLSFLSPYPTDIVINIRIKYKMEIQLTDKETIFLLFLLSHFSLNQLSE
jgi:hypothetical protein